MDKLEGQVANIVGEIRSLHPRVERTIEALRIKLEQASKPLDDSNVYNSADIWRLRAFFDGMIKIKLIIEQNVRVPFETFGILSTSRYLLELLIWFRLLGEPRYCFTYINELLKDAITHAKEHLQRVRREIKLFHELEERELGETIQTADQTIQVARRSRSGVRSEVFARSHKMIAEEIDRIARRRLCTYYRDAETRGYSFQAALMEKQVVPQLEQEIEQLRIKRDNAISQMPKSAREDSASKKTWKDKAKEAGMIEQYELIYAFSSRLLHASPTTLTTPQKTLELNEFCVFLDFIYVSILDAIEMAERLVCIQNSLAN